MFDVVCRLHYKPVMFNAVEAQMTNKIIDKVRALLSKTTSNGCTEAEAVAAAHKAGQLIEKYNLELADLKTPEQSEVVSESWYGRNKSAMTEVNSIAAAVGSFTETQVWRANCIRPDTGRRGHCFQFMGLPLDVEFAIWLMDLFQNSLQIEWKKYRTTPEFPHSISSAKVKKSFAAGFSSRICSRLKSMQIAQQNERTEAEDQKLGALIVVKEALISSELEKLGLTFKRARTRYRRHDSTIFAAGQVAGGRVTITSGIGN